MNKLKFILLCALCCIFVLACDTRQYYEGSSVYRTSNNSANEKTAKVLPKSYDVTEAKVINFKTGGNGFIYIVEIPANQNPNDKYCGGGWELPCYIVTKVVYGGQDSYLPIQSTVYSNESYEKAKAAFDEGTNKK